VVDERGEIVDPSIVGLLLGLEILEQHGGHGTMLYDLRSSQTVPEEWQKNGGTPVMCRVGHAHIKKQIQDSGAIYASELSLHLYYGDLHGVESTDLSCLLLLSLLSKKSLSLSEIVLPYHRYTHSGEINFEIINKDEALVKIKESFASEILEENSIDGLWFRCAWGWVSVRKSNTEPVLRLNVETSTREKTQEVVDRVAKIISS
jgi:phosphomannomutase